MTMPRALRALAKDRESGWAFTLALCLPYLAFLIWMHVHHEMWRDEVHAWNLATQAHGFWDLVTGERMYEGHPPLWFWYLRVWTWFVQAAWGIQAATIAAATGAAVLLARFAPFPRYLKVFLLFSYFFGYEYTVMSRNYVLGWLLLCTFCTLYHPVRVRHISVGIALALLSLTSAYGLFMSVSLLLLFLMEQIRFSITSPAGATHPRLLWIRTSPWTATTCILVAVAVVFCVRYLEPPDPNPFSPAFNFPALTLDALPAAYPRLTSAFFPWAKWMRTEFWLLPFEFQDAPAAYLFPLAAALAVFLVVALWSSRRLLLTFIVLCTVMEIFHTVRFAGVLRHRGHFLMFFIAMCWLLRDRLPNRRHLISTALLLLIVPFQLRSLAVATVVDTREAFSGARETAEFIRRQGLQDLPLFAGPDFMAGTLAGYLQRSFTAAETEEIGRDVVFHGRRRPYSPDQLLSKAVRVARERKTPVLLVSLYPIPEPPAGFELTNLFQSRRGTVADETFTVYRLRAK